MDVRERLAAGEFNNKVPYPDRGGDRTVRSAALRAYHAGQDVANAEFRVALESENHMLNHPKADRLWDLAWEHGHSSGLQDVIHYYEEFLSLVQDSTVYLVERSVGGKYMEPVAICSSPDQVSKAENAVMKREGTFVGIVTTISVDKIYLEGIGTCDHQHIGEGPFHDGDGE